MVQRIIVEALELAPDAVVFPQRLVGKVAQFQRDTAYYRSSQFKEFHLRTEFLSPLVEELGWDLQNSAGNLRTRREVIQEDSLTIDGTGKAPDYAFLINERRRFFP